MQTIGEQLARAALQQGQTSESLARAQRAFGKAPNLTADQIASAFGGRCTLETARALSNRLGRMLRVVGWSWSSKNTFADTARRTGLDVATVAHAVRALNDFGSASGNIRLDTLERVLSACKGARFELVGGREQ